MKHLYNGKITFESEALIRGRGGGCWASTSKAHRKPQKQNKKKIFVDAAISNVLCDLPFFSQEKSPSEVR